jgi:EpsI family protein
MASLATRGAGKAGPLESGPVIALFLILAAFIAANGEPIIALANLWTFGGHAYGWFVVIAAGWMLWLRRDAVPDVKPLPDAWGLSLVGAVAVCLWFAYVVDVRLAEFALLIAGTLGLVWTFLGRSLLRTVTYPIAFLLLALPFWDYVKPVLQQTTVNVTAGVLRWFGIPVFVDQTYINIPSGTVIVLTECSGVQFLQAGAILGGLYAYTHFRLTRMRVAVLTIFVSMVIMGNWARVCTLVFLGPLSKIQHLNVGWAVFVMSLLPAYGIALMLKRWEERLVEQRDASSSYRVRETRALPSLTRMVAIAVTAAALLVLVPSTATLFSNSPLSEYRLASIEGHSPWSGPFSTQGDWEPLFVSADQRTIASYRKADRSVVVFRAYYGSQKQGIEAVNDTNRVYNPSRWKPRGDMAAGDYRSITVGERRALVFTETRLEDLDGGADRLVWQWYEIAGREVARPWQAKLAQVLGLTHGRKDATVIVVSTNVNDLDEARTLLKDFVAAHFDELGRLLPQS